MPDDGLAFFRVEAAPALLPGADHVVPTSFRYAPSARAARLMPRVDARCSLRNAATDGCPDSRISGPL